MKNREQDHSRESGEDGCASPYIGPDGNVYVDKIQSTKRTMLDILQQLQDIRKHTGRDLYLYDTVDRATEAYIRHDNSGLNAIYNFIEHEIETETEHETLRILCTTRALLDILQ